MVTKHAQAGSAFGVAFRASALGRLAGLQVFAGCRRARGPTSAKPSAPATDRCSATQNRTATVECPLCGSSDRYSNCIDRGRADSDSHCLDWLPAKQGRVALSARAAETRRGNVGRGPTQTAEPRGDTAGRGRRATPKAGPRRDAPRDLQTNPPDVDARRVAALPGSAVARGFAAPRCGKQRPFLRRPGSAAARLVCEFAIQIEISNYEPMILY